MKLSRAHHHDKIYLVYSLDLPFIFVSNDYFGMMLLDNEIKAMFHARRMLFLTPSNIDISWLLLEVIAFEHFIMTFHF